jgi:putative photosynthetic complex assembly protein
MSALDDKPFPKGALIGAAALVISTVVGVGLVQIGKANGTYTPIAAPKSEIVASRDLRFIDANDGVTAFGGGVAVLDAVTGAEIARLEPTDGFVRVVLSSLAYERTRRASGEQIFRLVQRQDRSMSLEDLGTGTSINLGAFGPENRSRFLRFLPPNSGLG